MDAKAIINNIKGVKSIDKDKYFLDNSKGTFTSALIGGGIGFLLSYNYKQNLLIGTIIGAGIAGVIANAIANKK